MLQHRYEHIDNATRERMEQLRQDVGKLLEGDIPAANQNHLGIKVSDISDTSQIGGTSRAYRIARLKRDAPDLAQQVIAGDISAAEGITA